MPAIIVGLQALANPRLSLIQELCEAITTASGATLGLSFAVGE